MKEKQRVALVFGGRSGEHDVSLMTAESILSAIDRDRFEPVPVGITKAGLWLTGPDALKALQFLKDHPDPSGQSLSEVSRFNVSAVSDDFFSVFQPRESAIDVVFPLLHGPYGEDGTVQSIFQLAGLPYVGAGVASSAAAMDKALMKALFRDAGLSVVKDVVITGHEWKQNPESVVQRIVEKIGFPCFVKPANLGSSVGISKVDSLERLGQAVDMAGMYDRKIIIEQAAVGFSEVECGILGNDQAEASLVGEIVSASEFYDYHAKYFNPSSKMIIPAPLSPELASEIQEQALRAFRAVDASGISRVDFFVQPQTGEIYVNEINTMPGFTRTSMYPELWKASGITYTELVTRLIDLAFERFATNKTSLP